MPTATERPKAPTHDVTQYQLVHVRLPQPLARKLRAFAARNGRTMNTELFRMIQAAMDNEPDTEDMTAYVQR